ncbi:MAG: radical SAM protein [Candidatus Thiodiazotropha endolucinida]
MSILLIVPPAALSMANGPPLGAVVVQNMLERGGIPTRLYDANIAFLRYLMRPEVSREISGILNTRINTLLDRTELTVAELSTLGRTITFAVYEEGRTNGSNIHRIGMDWAAVSEILLDRQKDEYPDRICACIRDDAFDHIVSEIMALKPCHIAFSALFHIQYDSLIAISKLLRQRGFSGRIVIGGAATKLSGDGLLTRLLRESSADLIYTLDLHSPPDDLIAYLSGATTSDSVYGAVVLETGKDNSQTDIRRVPITHQSKRRLVGPLTYRSPAGGMYFEERNYPIFVSEGCYWGKCDFCDYPYLASRDPLLVRTAFRQPADVISDIEHVAKDHGVSRFDLISDAVPLGYFPRLVSAGGERLQQQGIAMECSIRAEPRAKQSQFNDMAKIGVDAITIGVEVLADDVLLAMGKGNTYADILRTINFARRAGIRVKTNLIIDHPRIASHHLSEMISRLEDLTPLVESIGVHAFSLSPYAPIANDLENVGIELIPSREERTTDHGDHTLAFRRLNGDPELSTALDTFRTAVEHASFQLDKRHGRLPPTARLITLPYRWWRNGAKQDANGGNIVLKIPGESAPFEYFAPDTGHLGHE